ncbi:carbon starvation protein A [Luteolibacter yonseiensis]|uniref:Carbon starvation protein A n=1 Tax=Luteolibacter yonseiensis TaxID=1144680 RepID=A0A934R4V0_9BACT|nr:carbon starvation CstA family protein [Luteolibacter yonseiensis]MBK1816043.1 carbon starvation protein A [Luteolibacter yonseiensis]
MTKLLRVLLWLAISLLGATAVGVAAIQRDEPINALWLVVAGVCTFAVAYRFYSAWLVAKVLTVDDNRAPAAVTCSDGKDFVPTPKWVVFGHHFAAIAGPGPLVGPVLAAQFGYLPGTLWILVGATLGGGVHDAVILFASMRRNGKSLGQMLKEEMNPVIGLIAMISLLAIMTILLAVLGLVVVKALAESPWGLFTIAATIPLAFIMGVLIKTGKASVTAASVFGVFGLIAAVVGGKYLPPSWTAALTLQSTQLAWAIMIYGFAASVLPVWMLLAPRDYLSTFMKLGTVAVLGVFIVILAPPLHMPAITPFVNGGGFVVPGPVFPFVCITIACGAVSGFHALISSGTTPKLLAREKDIRLIGYGSMVVEMLVSLMAIIAACALMPGEYLAINSPINPNDPAAVTAQIAKINSYGPAYAVTEAHMQQLAADLGEPHMIGKVGGAPTFAVGMAHMFAQVIPGKSALSLWYHFAIMFEALFILTTLDAGTRVGRFILQDLLGQISPRLGNTGSWLGNVTATGLLVAAWGFFLYQGALDPAGIAKSLWPIFGISNQLLAVIAFCLGTVVLIKMGKARYCWVTVVPMLFLTLVTFTAGYMKLFSPGAGGFYPEIEKQKALLASGLTGPALKAAETSLFNARIDVAVTITFLLFVTIIVLGTARECYLLLTKRKTPVLRESPYVAHPGEDHVLPTSLL